MTNPRINPNFNYYASEPICVEQEEYDAILNNNHGYGPDCIPGNSDDPSNESESPAEDEAPPNE